MKFIDLFSGIGGFRLGMEMAGHECAGYVEIDKYARKSYEAIHNTEGEWTAHDITTVTDDDIRHLRGTVDVICGGFPCQAFSIAGNRKGFEDTRGTLFFDIARIANIIRPRYLFLENVKGLLNHDGGNTFRTILRALDELGYDAEWQVLNSKDYGVPQNRERVFIIGHLRGAGGGKVFPISREKRENHSETKEVSKDIIIQKTHGFSITVNRGEAGTLQAARLDKIPMLLKRDGHGYHSFENFSPTLTANAGTGGNNMPFILDTKSPDEVRVYNEFCPTLQANDFKEPKQVSDGVIIRKLTPRETWRLSGFPDWAFDKAQEVNSNSQLYKQAGNSVTVNVVYEIAKRLDRP